MVDAQGHLRGIVTIKTETGGIAERATEVRQLLESNGLEPSAGVAAGSFREGMQALWRLDLPAAESGFDATLAAYPRHALAERERSRTRELEQSSFALSGAHRLRGGLLAVGGHRAGGGARLRPGAPAAVTGPCPGRRRGPLGLTRPTTTGER